MSGYRRVNYYELCRLCTSSEGDKMNIFREEGRRRQLQSKIQACLPVQVLEEDSLPKIVCHECVRKLESYIEFRENVVNAESMLESYFTSLRFSEDFLKEGKVYVKSTEKERAVSPHDDPLKIDKVEDDDGEPLLVTEPHGQAQQVVVGNMNTPNIQIISGVQARVQQYKCAMQMQSGGVTSAVVEATAETHYSYQQQTSQTPENPPPQTGLVEAQVSQLQVQNQIPQNQITIQPQRSQPQLSAITQIHQLREFEKRQLQLEKEQTQSQTQPQVVHTSTVLLKAPELSPSPQGAVKEPETHTLESPDPNVQNFTSVQATPEVFLSLNFKDSAISQQTPRDEVKEFKDYIKTADDPITRNSIGQISEFLRIRTCPDTNSLITVNPQVICEDRDLVCRDCGKTFDSLDQMDTHDCCPPSPLMSEVVEIKEEPVPGNGGASFSCDVCGKPFKRKEHLFQHGKLHTGERPYVCTTCAKAFSRKEHLVRHSVSHTGHKMHECEMCGKSFSRKDNLHKHRKTHGVSGPYVCETCGKSFVVKHYYLMHLTTHAPSVVDGDCADPLPYKCDLCHKAFSVKQYLTTHKLRHRSKNSQNQNNQSGSVQQAAVSTTNGVGSGASASSLSNSGQGEVVEIQGIDRSEGQGFGSNQYQGNVQGFQ